ncbi:MAG: S-layer homology domain-containing protein [Patescibacteria group bacterium]
MSKHKSTKHHSRLHQVVSGVIAAAFAFTTVISQVGSINGENLKASLPTESKAFLDKYSENVQKLYVSGGTSAWYYEDAIAAVEAGLLTGDTDKDGNKVMNPDALTNWAEGLTMLARVVAGGKDNIPNEADIHIGVVHVMPDWAQSSVYFLIKNGRIDEIDLESLFKGNKPSDPLTRIEMMQLASKILKIEKKSYEDVLMKFPDAISLTGDKRRAAEALVEAGVIGGEADGKLNPNGNLNRAAFVKILMVSKKTATDRGTLSGVSAPVTPPVTK